MQNPIIPILPNVVEKLTESVIYQNESGEIIYANPAAAKIFGLPFEQLVSLSFSNFYWHSYNNNHQYLDFLSEEEHPSTITLKTGEHQKDVILGVTKEKNDAITWVKLNTYPILNGNGKARGVITTLTNITNKITAYRNFETVEKNLTAALSGIKEGFYLINKKLEITVINDEALKLHTQIFNKRLSIGDNILTLFPSEKLDKIKECFKRAFDGEKIGYEVDFITAGNRLLWIYVNYEPVVYPDNKDIQLVSVNIRDITKRKLAEENLIDSEKKFGQLLSKLGDTVWEHDFITGTTLFSEEISDLAAYQEDDRVINNDKIWRASVHKKDQWILEQNDKLYLQGKIDHHSVEYRLLLKNGDIKWVLDRGVVIEKDASGKPTKIIGTHTDITRRKQIEEELKANEAKFRGIFNSTFQFMGLMTSEGVLLEANRTATEFFRLPKEEVIGMNFLDSRWFSDVTKQKAKAALTKAAKGETVNYELELNLLDGRDIVLDFSIRPLFDTGDNVSLLVLEGRDITEKLRMEKEIEKERINKQKEILSASIEGQEKQRQEIARELHDNINQILATIKIYLQMAIENENLREILIQKSFENISQTIEEVRKLSKSLALPALTHTTLTEAIKQMANDMVLSLLFKISFVNDEFEESLLNNLQKITIYRVAQEQFTNILKYAKAKKIEIMLATTFDKVIMQIVDDGIGFDTTKKQDGIGIRNMMNRVESQNGTFTLMSESGKGCKLKIELPLIKSSTYEEN
ncbi:MAG TPA: PAS domain S-box protein [Chitinophagaceae bacterium]|nr:PAS domain S-box protein [Chitinophagaceae bacterium]